MEPPSILSVHATSTILRERTRTCPIANISFETLSHIFELAEASFRADFGPFVSTPSTCALSFTRVCRFWYAVALKTPVLWTSVAICSETTMGSARQWFDRALNSQLIVDLRVDPRGAGVTPSTAYKFLDGHRDRLTRFSMEVTTPHNPRYAWLTQPNTLTSLELINVWMSFQNLCLLLRLSPRLQDLTVVRSHGHPEVSSFFEQAPDDASPVRNALTRLRLDSFALGEQELCRFFSLSPQLQYLSLSFSTPLPATVLGKVELPALLGASLPVASFTERLFRRWKTPSLRLTVFDQAVSCNELHEVVIGGRPPMGTSFRMDFTVRSRLSLSRQLWYIGHSPQITRLLILGCKRALRNILEFICTPRPMWDGYPLPNLRDLAIMMCSSKGDLDILQYRYGHQHGLRSPPPLRSLYMFGCPAVSGVASTGVFLESLGTRVEVSLDMPDDTELDGLFPDDDS